MSDEDYLRLLEQLTSQQYGDFDDEILPDLEDIAWTPEPEAKTRVNANSNKCIDLTKESKFKIKDKLFEATNFKVGAFFIRIKKYRGTIDNYKSSLYMDISLYEEKLKTPNGKECKIMCAFNPVRDGRFSKCDWITYFKIPSCGFDVPTEEVINIIKWMQFVNKNPAFI